MRTILLFALSVCLCVGAVAQSGHERKVAAELRKEMRRADSVDVSVSLRAKAELPGGGWRILLFNGTYGIALLRLPFANLSLLAEKDAVVFISRRQEPREELTTGAVDMTLNGLTLTARRYPNLRGDSVAVLIKERRFDPSDPDLRGRVFATGLEAAQLTAHAGQMATIIGGRGTTSPEARGAAPSATLGSTDFARLLPDPDSIFQLRGVHLQNHSYGTAVENFYGNEAMAYDQQSYSRPDLLHVFSAGNAGSSAASSGLYAGLAGVANLTGNFKQAKNVVTVGAMDSAGQPMSIGSQGPAYDGRIKPELMAYGEDGSSGAAALVSGAAVLVQQAWKRSHAGSLPSSSMVRALLVNSADDLSTPGPDYRTGFGLLNAYAALRTLEEGKSFSAQLAGGGEQVVTIQVPAGVGRLKVTLAWTDRPAVANAPKALINDLDLQVRSVATGTNSLPLVPDPTPALAALQAPAEQKTDTLNTIEQVTIESPAPGAYELRVKAGPFAGSQAFSLVWQWDSTGSFYWTFPAGDPVEAGRRQWLRWRSMATGPGTVEYATEGANWRPIGTVGNLSVGGLNWDVPDSFAIARLRMRFANGQVVETDPFTISRRPQLQTGFDCADSFMLYWQGQTGVRHLLSAMGAIDLQPTLETADSLLVLPRIQYPQEFFALTPLISGRPGIRSATINYRNQGSGCYIAGFYLQSQHGRTARFRGELGSRYRLFRVGLEKWTGSTWTEEMVVDPAALGFDLLSSSLFQGENRYRMSVTLFSGQRLYSEAVSVFYLDGKAVLVYPNPAGQQQPVRVRSEEAGRFRMQVVDLQGRILRNEAIDSYEVLIPAGTLSKGLYLIRFTDREGRSIHQKLVVQ